MVDPMIQKLIDAVYRRFMTTAVSTQAVLETAFREGTWYVLCMFPEGAHMIGCEEYEDARTVAEIHRERHTGVMVKILWAPEDRF